MQNWIYVIEIDNSIVSLHQKNQLRVSHNNKPTGNLKRSRKFASKLKLTQRF